MFKKTRTKDMTDIESILEKNTDVNYSNKWHPTIVSCFEKSLSTGALEKMEKEIRKNIAYSLQYLEFLQLELCELHLHSIIEMQIKKTYIITAMGIIEAIFTHLVKSNGFQKKEEWLEGTPIHTNVFRDNDTDKKYKIIAITKSENPVDVKMDFEYLINKVQEKKLLNINHKVFPFLKALKRIRNKVHLQIVRHENDTDYLSILNADYLMMRYLIYSIFRDRKLDIKDTNCLSFLNISNEEIEQLKSYLKENNGKENKNE